MLIRTREIAACVIICNEKEELLFPRQTGTKIEKKGIQNGNYLRIMKQRSDHRQQVRPNGQQLDIWRASEFSIESHSIDTIVAKIMSEVNKLYTIYVTILLVITNCFL